MSESHLVCDPDGNDLDARFFVERMAEDLTVVIESSGAGATTRNVDYDEGLRLILERLGTVDALLVRVEVDSTRTAGLSTETRTIAIDDFPSPVLVSDVDSYKLRRAISGGAAKTARRPNAQGGGNPRKRLRLFLAFPTRAAPPSVDKLTQVIRHGELAEPRPLTVHDGAVHTQPSAIPSRGRTGQGFEANTAVRLAVEEYAMIAAEQYYARANWATKRCAHLNLGYDILCTQAAEQLFVEVKGTRGGGSRVVITTNEARYAHAHPKYTELFILFNIQVATSEGGLIICTGGEPLVIPEWDPHTYGTLVPKDYYWYIPTN